jgi:hypothetical protein
MQFLDELRWILSYGSEEHRGEIQRPEAYGSRDFLDKERWRGFHHRLRGINPVGKKILLESPAGMRPEQFGALCRNLGDEVKRKSQ